MASDCDLGIVKRNAPNACESPATAVREQIVRSSIQFRRQFLKTLAARIDCAARLQHPARIVQPFTDTRYKTERNDEVLFDSTYRLETTNAPVHINILRVGP
jgi:hypothetical protein